MPQGLTIQGFDLPFQVRKGVLRTVAGKVPEQPPPAPQDTNDAKSKSPLAGLFGGRNAAEAEAPAREQPQRVNVAKPETAWCNRGALDFAGITIDMTKPQMLISIPKNKPLLRSVRLNPVLADTLGGPTLLFKNADDATGLLDVTVVACDQVPLSEFAKPHPNARANISFAVSNLHLDGPVPTLLSQGLQLGGQGIDGGVEKGSIALANGTATSGFTLNLTQYEKVKDQSGQKRTQENALPIQFNGAVTLASGELHDFYLNIPAGLIPPSLLGGRDPTKLLPQGVRVPVTGTTEKPNLNLVKAITDTVGNNLLNPENIGDILGGLTGKKKDDKKRK